MIRHMLTELMMKVATPCQKNMFETVVSLCNLNPRRPSFITQLAIKNGEFFVKCIHEWSEPPEYTDDRYLTETAR